MCCCTVFLHTVEVCIYIDGVGWYIALFLGRLRLWMWSVVISVSVGQPMEYYLKVRMLHSLKYTFVFGKSRASVFGISVMI